MSSIEIREILPDDFENACRIHIDPRTNQFHPHPPNRADFVEIFESWLSTRQLDGFGYFAAAESSQCIGIGGVCKKRSASGVVYNNLYFRVDADHHGKGVATLLGKAGLQVARQNDWPLIAMAAPENAASLHMIKKLGLVPLDDHQLEAEGRLVFHLPD